MVESHDTRAVGHRYGIVPVPVLQALSGDAMGVAVYAALAAHADRNGDARPLQSTLAELLGIEVPTVSRTITRLCAARVVTKGARMRDGRKIGNDYHLPFTPGFAPEESPDLRHHASPRARDRSSRKEQLTMNKEIPPPSEPHLAVVVPMPTGRLLEVPSVVDAVFDAWVKSTGRTGRTILNPKRRRVIEARVKEGYRVDDLVDAVQGWKRSPFHCGQNEQHTVYNELTLLLRDGEQVEKFRDLYRQGAASSVASMQADPNVLAIQRQREREGRG